MDELQDELRDINNKIDFLDKCTITPEEGKGYIIYDLSEYTPSQRELLKAVIANSLPLFNRSLTLLSALDCSDDWEDELSALYQLINKITCPQ